MANTKVSAETRATGYFNVTHNGIDLFKSDSVHTWRTDNWLVIDSSVNDGRNFTLDINPFTSTGSQPYVPGGEMGRVYYIDEIGRTLFAQSGTFDATLDHASKKYRITFRLNFAILGEVLGDIDVTE